MPGERRTGKGNLYNSRGIVGGGSRRSGAVGKMYKVRMARLVSGGVVSGKVVKWRIVRGKVVISL